MHYSRGANASVAEACQLWAKLFWYEMYLRACEKRIQRRISLTYQSKGLAWGSRGTTAATEDMACMATRPVDTASSATVDTAISRLLEPEHHTTADLFRPANAKITRRTHLVTHFSLGATERNSQSVCHLGRQDLGSQTRRPLT